MLTGCEDGLVRVVSVLPNKVLGVIGDHDGFPVEGFEFSSDRRMLASFSHDSVIRLWDASMFVEDDEGGDEDGEDDEHPEDKDDAAGMEVGEEEASEEEMSDDSSPSDDDEDSEDEDSDDEDSDQGNDHHHQGRKAGRAFPTAAERFFADM